MIPRDADCLRIAELCPIHRTLKSEIDLRTSLSIVT
jgi:uncharacterized OsmC-like protein